MFTSEIRGAFKILAQSLLCSPSRFLDVGALRWVSFGDGHRDSGFSGTGVLLAHSSPASPQVISEFELVTLRCM